MKKETRLYEDGHYRRYCDCPVCGERANVDTSVVLTSFPSQYSYYCSHCGKSGSIECSKCYSVISDDKQDALDSEKNEAYFKFEEGLEDSDSGYAVDYGKFINTKITAVSDYALLASDYALDSSMHIDHIEHAIITADGAFPSDGVFIWPDSLHGYCRCRRCGEDADVPEHQYSLPETKASYHCEKCGAYGKVYWDEVYYLKAEDVR